MGLVFEHRNTGYGALETSLRDAQARAAGQAEHVVAWLR